MARRFVKSSKGIGEMLVSGFMRRAMRARAEIVKVRAVAISPTGEPGLDWYAEPGGNPDRAFAPGHYKASFQVSGGVRVASGHPRAYGRVTNTAPYASAVEYGYGDTPRYRVLGRALGAVGNTRIV